MIPTGNTGNMKVIHSDVQTTGRQLKDSNDALQIFSNRVNTLLIMGKFI